jgi:S1-C subfamily serine protease
VTKEGHVLTNEHVVDGCYRITIQAGNSTGVAKTIKYSKLDDLALLETGLKPSRFAKWRSAYPRQGEDVVIYGFPLAELLAADGNVTTGIVVALAGLGNDGRRLQISAPIQPGSSGGPVLDRGGDVVGVVVSGLKDSASRQRIPQNVNFAIQGLSALRFLQGWNVNISNAQPSASMSTPDLADYAKAFTVHVVCEK